MIENLPVNGQAPAWMAEVKRVPPPYLGNEPVAQFLYRRSKTKGDVPPIIILVLPSVPVKRRDWVKDTSRCDCPVYYPLHPSEHADLACYFQVSFAGFTPGVCACNGEIIE